MDKPLIQHLPNNWLYAVPFNLIVISGSSLTQNNLSHHFDFRWYCWHLNINCAVCPVHRQSCGNKHWFPLPSDDRITVPITSNWLSNHNKTYWLPNNSRGVAVLPVPAIGRAGIEAILQLLLLRAGSSAGRNRLLFVLKPWWDSTTNANEYII